MSDRYCNCFNAEKITYCRLSKGHPGEHSDTYIRWGPGHKDLLEAMACPECKQHNVNKICPQCGKTDCIRQQVLGIGALETALDRLESFDFVPEHRNTRRIVLEQLLREFPSGVEQP